MKPAHQSPKLVILISGGGTNLQSFIDQVTNGQLPAQIAAVICNRPGAGGLKRAMDADITTDVVDHTGFDSREAFDAEMVRRIDTFEPDLVILAGFMRILTPAFVRHYRGRLLNIHPSLLPKYPGLHTHQRAIDAGDSEAGATVHFVTEELDGGPAVLQARVPIEPGDDAGTLAQRVLSKEHIIYPLAAHWFIEGRLVLKDNHAHLDNTPLGDGGWQYAD